ncbi:UNVERIFIED_CONTAM: hypothetical protein FKN15_030944 [Acipenser sinensis]
MLEAAVEYTFLLTVSKADMSPENTTQAEKVLVIVEGMLEAAVEYTFLLTVSKADMSPQNTTQAEKVLVIVEGMLEAAVEYTFLLTVSKADMSPQNTTQAASVEPPAAQLEQQSLEIDDDLDSSTIGSSFLTFNGISREKSNSQESVKLAGPPERSLHHGKVI